jgi:hypothetical protein
VMCGARSRCNWFLMVLSSETGTKTKAGPTVGHSSADSGRSCSLLSKWTGRRSWRPAAPVLPAHPRRNQAAGRRGGPTAGQCKGPTDTAEALRGGHLTGPSRLERSYRRVLTCHPTAFRRERGRDSRGAAGHGRRGPGGGQGWRSPRI